MRANDGARWERLGEFVSEVMEAVDVLRKGDGSIGWLRFSGRLHPCEA
jgi:hypothetical protein